MHIYLGLPLPQNADIEGKTKKIEVWINHESFQYSFYEDKYFSRWRKYRNPERFTKLRGIADAEKAVNSLFTSFRGDEVATSPDGKESMDIGSDDASNDVVECSDGKEATGSDKEIKGHSVD